MSETNVDVTRDEEGNVHAHWVGSMTFHPSVYGDPESFHSLMEDCVEEFTRVLRAKIDLNFKT
ncbi:hypothetical protein [Mycobacterium sp. 1274761.0]|uniref:hypothetical protein n=1 Tax=Mycobacterium sp. 1274761.0 TaxID=1834077 RepID=UPI0007FCA80D|nr:hypothetical protein [Mycobacterium sp. 1274761.0]OBK72205.1 hypothetical protein A5651_16860 [Mycobacterium sp. 1274761.0]